MTLDHSTNRGADGRSLDGLRGNDGEHKNNESGALEGETHDRKKLAMKGPEGIELSMEETLEAFSYNTISSRGPNNSIAGNDMHIISNGNQETHGKHNDMDNNDTRSNGRGVTNGYAFGSDMDRLTGTPD